MGNVEVKCELGCSRRMQAEGNKGLLLFVGKEMWYNNN